MSPKLVLVLIWCVWLVSWVAASGWAKATVTTPGRAREVPYRLLQGAGFALLFASLGLGNDTPSVARGSSPLSHLFAPVWDLPLVLAWCATGLAAVGFVFAWWARLHLGALWSSSVTRKEGHRVIDTGPYGIVRHPIYTGLLFATIALAAIGGTPAGMIGLVLVVTGVVMKARLEERFLAVELGADVYNAYRRRVPMLVPGLHA